MKTKKIISALAAAAAASGILSALTLTAGAAEINLSYKHETDSTVLSKYAYADYGKSGANTYTLTEEGKTALANAQDGDTVTVTYNIESEGEARYRCGFKFIGVQFYVNANTETGKNAQFIRAGACHLNGDLVNNSSAEVKYEIVLNDGGTVKSVTPSITAGTTTATYGSQTNTVAGQSLETIILNTADRNAEKTNDFATLTNFSAVLTTSYVAPEPEINPTAAEKYEPKVYEGTDKGYFVTLNGTGNTIKWYAKASADDDWTEIASAAAANSSSESGNVLLSGDSDYVYGLIINGLSEGDSLEGYSFGAELTTME